MRPTFMGFETATRGLMANQKSLDIVANNLTNIGVTGYTRQRTDLVSLSVNMRHTRYNEKATSFAGQGVGIYGVSQIRDPFLDRRFREEYGDVGYYDLTAAALEDLHGAIDEINPSTISVALMNFQNAWTEMQIKGNEATNAANILASANQIVSIFQQMARKLDNVWNQQEYNLELNINEVNSILERVADLNDEIHAQEYNRKDTNTRPLELLDQRNVLLDQLAGFGDITYREELNGQVTVFMGGHKVVDGDEFEKLDWSVDESDDRYKTVSVFWESSGDEVDFMSGSILGSLHMLNGRGINSTPADGENDHEGILYYKEKIDQFARTFADAFNTAIELDGGGHKALFEFDAGSDERASSIRIAEAWRNDATYLYAGIADKITEGSDSNTFAAKASQIFETELDFGEFEGTLNDYIMFYSITKLSNNKAYTDERLKTVNSIANTLLDQIQQVSGVSFEEEGIDMLRFQKAYEAVARVFTTMDELLDKLINETGLVGR